MTCLNMPMLIVGAFLLLTLVVGIYFSRKKLTFQEYAIGNKNFSTATLVATVLATSFGGGTLVRNIESVYGLGLYYMLAIFLDYFGFWIIGKLALRMGPFMHHLSMPETIGSIYGKYPRIIAAFINICGCILIITAQINIIAQAFEVCFGSLNPFLSTILSTLILIFYSIFGGIRAVTYTDVLQFICFSLIIPLICWFMFIKVNKPISDIVLILESQDKFQWSNLFQLNSRLVGLCLLILAFLVSHIQPSIMQRVYMSSNPIQAQKAFSYATFFSWIIISFIVLISLFISAAEPSLSREEIWKYITGNISPVFKGLLSICLLTMAMSTADSFLNICSIMFIHDIVNNLKNREKNPDLYQLKTARSTTLIVGLLAMVLCFYYKDFLKIIYLYLDWVVPIVTAPFVLGIYGFRGTSRTALIGMATGLLTILVWGRWVSPSEEIDGAFIAMVTNGLAMLAAHYLLKQPKNTGWAKPDNTFKQITQERFRKHTEQKEVIKNSWKNKKITLSKLVPGDRTLYLTGLYMMTIAIISYWFIRTDSIHWAICQVLVGVLLTFFKIFFGKKMPAWFIGLIWIIALAIYLPLKLVWYCWHIADPIFGISLSLAHCIVILWVFPLYLAIRIVATTWFLSLMAIGWSVILFSSIFPLFVVSLLVFSMSIWFKVKIEQVRAQNIYLMGQEKIRADQKMKASLYEAALIPSTSAMPPKGYGFILNQVVRKVEESISFLDNHTALYKEDFQSLINKFYDWIAYFNRREKAKDHALLQPDTITLDKLIRKVELALSQEINHPPKLLIKKIRSSNQEPCAEIVCDINQVVYSLVKAILRIGKSEGPNIPIVTIQLHPTFLQFKEADSIDQPSAKFIDFKAVALVVSQSTTANGSLPKVKSCYNEMDFTDPKVDKDRPPSIDIEQDTISSIVRAHYGYLKASFDEKAPTMLMVLPSDVTDLINKMTIDLPLDALTIESLVTPKEEADSMMVLMQFHDHVCKLSCENEPIDLKIVSGILLLLRKHFRFKRHASGQLFYVRQVGIAKLVTNWVFHSPKVVYAALLYGLVRRTCLPLSYIKQHYNLGVYAFVSNVVGIDKRKDLDHPSLLYVQNRLKQAIKEEHVQLSVLFIKLDERLYDLRHAAGYMHLSEVKHMAQETLTIDVEIANTYLGEAIAQALEEAAKQALEVCALKNKKIIAG